MSDLSRVDVIRLLACSLLLILPVTSRADQLPPVAEQMAKAFGLDSFEKITAIRYSFTIEGLVTRSWEWNPKSDTVSYDGKDMDGKPLKVTYRRGEIDSQSDVVKNMVDPAFVNDQYWLILPFHVAWDGATVTDDGQHETPQAKTPAERIVVKYAASGYSPGDTWELYVGPDKRVVEMTYHRAVPAPKLPNLVNATWEGYKKAGPLLISTDHHGTGDGRPFRLTFTEVSVKLQGSKNWIKAQ